MMLSVSEAARSLNATPEEVIDASGLTLGELEAAALDCGLLPWRFREAPILSEASIESLSGRIADSRLPI